MVRKRSSRQIALVMIAGSVGAAVSGCSPQSSVNSSQEWRDKYATIEDCMADWTRAENCQPASNNSNYSSGGSSGSGTGSRVIFLGPIYGDRDRASLQQLARDEAVRSGLRPSDLPNRSSTQTSPSLGRFAVSNSTSASARRGGFGSSSRGLSGGG